VQHRHRGRIADIAGHRERLPAELLGDRRSAFAIDVHDRNRRLLLRQPLGDRASDALRRARHDRHPSLEPFHHLSPSC
jgi:hypothetical protein